MVTVDNSFNIQRIIDRIKAYAPLYDNGATVGKVREIIFGKPVSKESIKQKPAIYVTTVDNIQNTKYQYGFSNPNTQGQISVSYEIVIVAAVKDQISNSEKQLYDILMNLRDMVSADPRFSDPANPGTSQIFSRSVINEPKWDPKFKGQLINSVSVTLLCQIGSLFTLDIAGFTGISLISKPIEREVEQTENIYNTARIREGVSPISETHSFFAEMEYVEAQVAAMRTQKRNRAVISATLTRPSGTTVYSGKLVEISNGASFDQFETVTILFEVIH